MAIGQKVLAHLAVGLPSLRRHASRIVREAGAPVAVIDGERIAAYLVPAAIYEKMMNDRMKRSRVG